MNESYLLFLIVYACLSFFENHFFIIVSLLLINCLPDQQCVAMFGAMLLNMKSQWPSPSKSNSKDLILRIYRVPSQDIRKKSAHGTHWTLVQTREINTYTQKESGMKRAWTKRTRNCGKEIVWWRVIQKSNKWKDSR